MSFNVIVVLLRNNSNQLKPNFVIAQLRWCFALIDSVFFLQHTAIEQSMWNQIAIKKIIVIFNIRLTINTLDFKI